MQGVIEWSGQYSDEDGELRSVVSDCVKELEKISDDTALRRKALQVLFAMYRYDVEMGGIGFGDESLEVMLEKTTQEERHEIAGWVREQLKTKSADDSEWGRSYRERCYGGFLLDLEEDT